MSFIAHITPHLMPALARSCYHATQSNSPNAMGKVSKIAGNALEKARSNDPSPPNLDGPSYDKEIDDRLKFLLRNGVKITYVPQDKFEKDFKASDPQGYQEWKKGMETAAKFVKECLEKLPTNSSP